MLHKNVADKFSFENCKFRVQKNKEGTGRIVVWVMGVTNSYTLEASFAGSTMGGRAGTHFSTMVSLFILPCIPIMPRRKELSAINVVFTFHL
jgi:hypothetical protein